MHEAVAAHSEWLLLRGCSPATVYERERAITRLEAALSVPLLEATAAGLHAWRAALTVAPGTVRDYISHAQQFYAWAVADGRITSNPVEGLPVPRRARGLPRPVGEGDLARAVGCAPPRIRPWLVLAGWAGLRAREIALLQREAVAETADPPVLLVTAEAAKGRHARVVPLSPFVLAELRAAHLPAAGWVFGRADGRGGPNSPATVSHLANRHLHACGVAATLHQLRHRFASMVYKDTRDIRLVQELLGHQDVSTTSVYAAFDRPLAHAAVANLPALGRLRPVSEAPPGGVIAP